MDFHSSDFELKDLISESGLNAQVNYYSKDSILLRYIQFPNVDTEAPILLTLHGAPGSCSDYSKYWNDQILLNQFEIVSVDRPGYGGSHFSQHHVSIKDQGQIIMDMITELAQDRSVVILSHSYGAPVGARIASLLGSLCLGHVMVAPVLDPVSEEVFWYSSIPVVPPFSWFSSNDWKSATAEKKVHISQLELLQPTLETIPSRTIHVHGTIDWLAPFQNVDFALKNFHEDLYESVVIEGGSHFILWEDEIEEIIKGQVILLNKPNDRLMGQ